MCLGAKPLFTLVVLTFATLPAAAANLPGQPCSPLGVTQMADDKISLVACLQTGTGDATLIWKPMTPVYGLPNGNIGIGVTNPVTSLDVKGSVKIGTSETDCTSALAGTIRYNSSASALELCNGTSWRGGGGCYVDYALGYGARAGSGCTAPGFTVKSSLGSWGYCSDSCKTDDGGMRPPGGRCPGAWGSCSAHHTAGEAYLCCGG